MKVAVVSPPFGDTGGPEVVTQNLTNALLEKGIDVTLFAPADFKTKAKHISTLPQSLWNMTDFNKQSKAERKKLVIQSQTEVLKHQNDFDIIHLNSQKYANLVSSNSTVPCVLTMHNRMKVSDFIKLKDNNLTIVLISKSQSITKKGVHSADETIINGISLKELKYSLKKGSYLLFVGRITNQKGVDNAIHIAEKANKKLIIIGRVGISAKRTNYFNKEVLPFIDNKNVIFIPEMEHSKIFEYYRNAEALLLPIKTKESAPVVVSEALASGTPVIGTKIDPLPEMIKNKSIGILSSDIHDLIDAAKNTNQFSRKKCREYAEKYFNSSVMADQYIQLYNKILSEKK
jgi:glycosyltransferase involved in cell wall biosynthesis